MFRRLCLAWLVAAIAPAAASVSVPEAPRSAAPSLPAATAFAERPFFSDPILSPGGKRIAARIHGDKESICVIEVAALEKGCVRQLPIGEGEADDVRWAGDDRLIVGLKLQVRDMYWLIWQRHYLVVDVADGHTKALNPKASRWSEQIIWAAPDGQAVLLSAQVGSSVSPGVKRIDLATGESQEVQKSIDGVYDWFADQSGIVRAGLGTRSGEAMIWYRDKGDEAFRRVEFHHLKKGAAARDDDMIDTLHFDGVGGKAIVVSNARSGRFGVYTYDPVKDQIGDALFEHQKVDVSDLVVDPVSHVVTGVAYEDDRPRVKWFDPATDALQAKIDHIFPQTSNLILDRSRDGNLVLVETGAPDRPGMYYLFNRAARRMEGLTSATTGLNGVRLATTTQLHYPARDGLDIPAYLTLPPGRSAKGLPLVMMPHGGPFERDHWEYDPMVQYLASRGYAVLQPQYRGSTGYGRDFVEKGFGQWGRAMQDDLLDGIDALAKAGTIDPRRVCIFGASYGGYAAMWAAVRDADRYRCAASYAGVSDLSELRRYDQRMFRADRYVTPFWVKRVEGARGFDLASVSPLPQQQKIAIPLLIGHGERDRRVPASQSHRLVTALEARHANVQSIFYKDEGHGFFKAKDLADFLDQLGAFMQRYNPA